MMQVVLDNWLWFMAVVILILVLGVIAVLSKYVRLLLNIIRDAPPPLMINPCDFDRREGRQVQFRSFDGTSLRGMFLNRQDLTGTESGRDGNGYIHPQTRGVIIFCHEYGSDKYSCARYCQALLEAGFDIFSFDFRGHGQSGNTPDYEPRLWCTDKEVHDCLGALAFVYSQIEEQHLRARIGLFGISRGAGAAVLAAWHARRGLMPVKAVLVDGCFSTDCLLEWGMKRWVHIFARVRFIYENHRPWFWTFLRWLVLMFAQMRYHCQFPSVRQILPRLRNTAVFFIHGEKDSYIRAEQAEWLYAAARSPKYLWVVPGAKHNQSVLVEPEMHSAHVAAFFERFLARAEPRGTEPDGNVTAANAFFETAENCLMTSNAKETPSDGHNSGGMDNPYRRLGRRTERRTPTAAV